MKKNWDFFSKSTHSSQPITITLPSLCHFYSKIPIFLHQYYLFEKSIFHYFTTSTCYTTFFYPPKNYGSLCWHNFRFQRLLRMVGTTEFEHLYLSHLSHNLPNKLFLHKKIRTSQTWEIRIFSNLYHSNFFSKYALRSSILILSCCIVSRSRTVTAPSSSESKS